MFGRSQGINFGDIPKLLAPEISLGGNFVFDTNCGYYITNVRLWILVRILQRKRMNAN